MYIIEMHAGCNYRLIYLCTFYILLYIYISMRVENKEYYRRASARFAKHFRLEHFLEIYIARTRFVRPRRYPPPDI